MKSINPFIVGRYEDPEYFCDRQEETNRIISAIENQRNLTLISNRRLGKTGLIQHVIHTNRSRKDLDFIYLDLMPTQNLHELISSLAKAVIGAIDNKTTKILRQFGSAVKSLRPRITVDSLTGKPVIDIITQEDVKAEASLEEIFEYIRHRQERIIIALDEFQQISNYPEKNTEARLRDQMQRSVNISFIFSGSQKHSLFSMFNDYNRPFYQSTELLTLNKIDRNKYHDFIIEQFTKGSRHLIAEVPDLILDLTDTYTYYVQYLCNKIYSNDAKQINAELVIKTLLTILKEQEVVYYNYRNLLTSSQFALLMAIAKEKGVKMITSGSFIQKHGLTSASTVASSLASLIDKEMIYQEDEKYFVYDIFFSRWLERL
jgi:hypothetical protein